jgi:hypothetical protein
MEIEKRGSHQGAKDTKEDGFREPQATMQAIRYALNKRMREANAH